MGRSCHKCHHHHRYYHYSPVLGEPPRVHYRYQLLLLFLGVWVGFFPPPVPPCLLSYRVCFYVRCVCTFSRHAPCFRWSRTFDTVLLDSFPFSIGILVFFIIIVTLIESCRPHGMMIPMPLRTTTQKKAEKAPQRDASNTRNASARPLASCQVCERRRTRVQGAKRGIIFSPSSYQCNACPPPLTPLTPRS